MKPFERLMSGQADANFHFSDLRSILFAIGFQERINGSHHIFFHDSIPEILNLQPKGAMAKPYQVKQVRRLILKYGLEINPQ